MTQLPVRLPTLPFVPRSISIDLLYREQAAVWQVWRNEFNTKGHHISRTSDDKSLQPQ
uniref:Uncharacterized protein n=1 Tax=Anopheles atroparvus TaxID=41427 RepID=A0AAG5DH50_ANOAO